MKISRLLLLCCCSTIATAVYASDSSTLANQLASLNAQGDAKDKNTREMVVAAVAHQTGLASSALRQQHASTGLGYGDLLAADSLASGSGKSLQDVLGLKNKSGKSWADLAMELRINPASIVARARNANSSVVMVREGNVEKHTTGEQKMRDAGLDANRQSQPQMGTGP